MVEVLFVPVGEAEWRGLRRRLSGLRRVLPTPSDPDPALSGELLCRPPGSRVGRRRSIAVVKPVSRDDRGAFTALEAAITRWSPRCLALVGSCRALGETDGGALRVGDVVVADRFIDGEAVKLGATACASWSELGRGAFLDALRDFEDERWHRLVTAPQSAEKAESDRPARRLGPLAFAPAAIDDGELAKRLPTTIARALGGAQLLKAVSGRRPGLNVMALFGVCETAGDGDAPATANRELLAGEITVALALALLGVEPAARREPDAATLAAAEARYMAATAELQQGRLEAAREGYLAALELDETYAEAWSNLGVVHAATGALEEAVTATRRALELKPDLGAAWYNLACALARQAAAKTEGEPPRELLTAAIDAIAKALDNGFTDLAHLRSDADLAALQGAPRFRRLVGLEPRETVNPA